MSFSASPKQTLNFAMLNVCGLKSRLNYPEFVSFFNAYDILCFVETKLDDTLLSLFQVSYAYQSHVNKFF